jgi:acyl-coenzyme A thioesterase PaaI-like protein
MIKAVLASNKFVVTAEMTVKYKLPVKVGERLKFIGIVRKEKGRLFFTEGSAVGEDGIVYATATGKYILATDELKEQLMKSDDK